ncbi:MAG: hemerythrin domain-containing protein [Comamonadaceae bacterium]|jgi:hemerythrin
MATEIASVPQVGTPIWKIEWSEALSVGITDIDEDHKRFARLVNELNRSIVDRAQLPEIRRRLQMIIDDAVQHFEHEERLFKEWQYADSQNHAAIHAQIIGKLHAIMSSNVSINLNAPWIEAGLQIKTLLIEHILKEDVKYARSY